MWGRWALGASLRPPFGASRLTPASAPPLGPGGVPSRDFQCCPPIVKKRSPIRTEIRPISKTFSYQHGSSSYQQNPRYQPKKRRYLYNRDRNTSKVDSQFLVW